MSSQIEKILNSTYYVVNKSEHVRINTEKVNTFCENIKKLDNITSNWLEQTPFNLEKLHEKEKANFLLVFNALSFSYWGDPYWQVTYKDQTYNRGSWSLVASILRSKEEGTSILDASCLSSISSKELETILRGNRKIPLFEERLNILHTIGTTLSEKYDKDFKNVINASNYDAINLVDIIVQNFPTFEDISIYNNQKIYFQKRAQALVESTHSLFQDEILENVNKLTALADYIIPKKLREEKILEYDSELSYKVDNKIKLEKGCKAEIEIRANTIWAVKYIQEELKNKSMNVTPIEINDYLWLTGGNKDTPFHLTRTTSY